MNQPTAPLMKHRDGLLNYLNRNLTKPTVPSDDEYAAMTPAERHDDKVARITYLSGDILFATPYTREAYDLWEECDLLNMGLHKTRSGFIINGEPHLGKTSTAKALMRHVWSLRTAVYPEWFSDGHTPIVYVEVPPKCNGKALMVAFAEFFGMTVLPRETLQEIHSRVIATLHRHRTELIVIDELHNLNGASTNHREAKQVLKSLLDDGPATLVLAGVDVDNMLGDALGIQLSGRLSMINLRPLRMTGTADKETWRRAIRAYERSLVLRHHEAGSLEKLSLEKLSSYLYERCGGSIGSLGKLITGAANRVIYRDDVESEAVTVEVMNTIHVDVYAMKKQLAGAARKRRTSTETLTHAESLRPA